MDVVVAIYCSLFQFVMRCMKGLGVGVGGYPVGVGLPVALRVDQLIISRSTPTPTLVFSKN
jgi:hypothetical protein